MGCRIHPAPEGAGILLAPYNDRGWYEDRLEDGFKIDEYNQIVVFLVTAAVLKNKYDGLDDATLEEFVDLDIVSEEFLQDLQSSVDIDYGH